MSSLSRVNSQRGVALMMLLLLVGVGALAVFVTALSRASMQQEKDRVSYAALALAKVALIGRAATDNNRPGSLPCPDENDDGIADTCSSFIGRLPWKTLDLPDLRDGYGERLWYEMSPNYKDNTSSEPINNISTIGSLDSGGIAAKLYGPGLAVGGQVRDAANVNSQVHYLEGQNDILLRVSDREIFSVARKRVAGEIRLRLNSYPYPGILPVPALPLRFAANWSGITSYNSTLPDEAQVSFTGCGMVFTMKWNPGLGQSEMSWTGNC